MPQNQEEIEAKLAAYIDGELDAAGRAEIEKHLQANPQHRVLIGDLTKQRELVRSLPRSNAPAEIAETLQGQLERSVLLGSGVDAGDDTSMRMSPWPHRGAIAAIVLLTAGLSFLVYKVLPSGKSSPELAVAPQSNSPATLSVEPPTGGEQPIVSAGKDRVFTEKVVPQQPGGIAESQSAAAPNAAAAGAVAPGAVAGNGGPTSNTVVADLGEADKKGAIENAPVNQARGNQAAGNQAAGNQAAGNPTAVAIGPGAIGGGVGAGNVGQGNFSNSNNAEPLQLKVAPQELAVPAKQLSPPQYLIVATNDPAATDAQVRAFLIANQIHFEPRSADAQVSDRDYVRSAMEFRRQLAEGGANASAQATAQPTTQPLTLESPSTQPVQQGLGNRVTEAGKLPTTAAVNTTVNGPTSAAGSIADALQPAATTAPVVGSVTAPTTAPTAARSGLNRGGATDAKSQANGEDVLRAGGQVQGSGLPATQPTTAPTEALEFATTQPVEGGETSFYCPDVTATQVQDLKSMLSRRAGQSADLVKVEVSRVPMAGSTLADGSFRAIAPTTQQLQESADQIASQQGQQFGTGQTQQAQEQSILAQQVPATQPASSPVSEGKMDLVIVMQPGAVVATPLAAPATPSTQPSVQPAVVPNLSGATQPVESEPALKLP